MPEYSCRQCIKTCHTTHGLGGPAWSCRRATRKTNKQGRDHTHGQYCKYEHVKRSRHVLRPSAKSQRKDVHTKCKALIRDVASSAARCIGTEPDVHHAHAMDSFAKLHAACRKCATATRTSNCKNEVLFEEESILLLPEYLESSGW